ncbi:MAG TPA: hypothetical protein VFY16_12410 [Gemmatimonadaceae bacterium]|jgi:hypothetical protein|nr:hypothetical protein [Gemmatimonadaceae bacterium]
MIIVPRPDVAEPQLGRVPRMPLAGVASAPHRITHAVPEGEE